MDELAISNGESSRYITTTSHPDEIAEEVIEFARSFGDQSLGDVHGVRV
jgi:hypothetical protein